MFLRLFLFLTALTFCSALPIRLARRTIYTSSILRRSEPARFERGVFVVQFRSTIDDTIMRRLQSILGYTPTEYVPTNALVLFINSTDTGERLNTALGTRIKHFEKLLRDDRRADIAQSINEMRARPPVGGELRASRVGAKEKATQELVPQTVRLRVRSFYGSSREHGEDVDRAKTYVAMLSNSMANLEHRPTPRVDDEAHHITVEDIDIEEAELAADSIIDNLDDVYWTEIEWPYELLNSWAVPVVHRASAGERTGPGVIQSTDWQPLMNLTGAGQIIGLSDTGIEYNCFFSDGKGPAGGEYPSVLGIDSVPTDTGHPKIRAYSSGVGGDLRDYGSTSGHGTHVAGIIAGRATPGTSSAKYNGVAPNARLAFIDLLQSGPNAKYLSVPDIGMMLQWFLDAGARIKSASWGSSNGGRYTIDDHDIDEFVWRHRTMLVVTAAGNVGKVGSISTPAMNKNGLTVGASMNGYDAYNLAMQPTTNYATTSPRWLASFSSLGSSSLSFDKPDVVAPGGQYVWSADNNAPLNGNCADETQTTTGYAGTSMATPMVSASAALLNEAFETRKVSIPASAGQLPAYASLLRAMLAASARPLNGIYPSATYKTQAARRTAEGFGRIALDRIIGPSVSLVILSNERSEHGLARVGSSLRACIDIPGLAQNATLADYEIVVQLAYTDYPSSISATATLINNLDLIVTPVGSPNLPYAVNYNAVNTSETRSTLERVIVPVARAVMVEVKLTQLGFGDMQTFSLIAALRLIAPSSNALDRTIVASDLSPSGGQCVLCDSDQKLQLTSTCASCGDDIVQSNEDCELNQTCCTANCKWASNTNCSITVGGCTVNGRCAYGNGTCAAPTGLSLNSACEVTRSPSVCAKSSTSWFTYIRANGALPFNLQTTNSTDLRICCQHFARFAYDTAPSDPLYFALASQYIAARLNFATPNMTTNSSVLAAIDTAKRILESRCGLDGLALSENRTRALSTIANLVAYNEPSCAALSSVSTESWCSASVASADVRVCGGKSNRYIANNATCKCSATRQQEPSCANLACSGRGSSVYDATQLQDRCICYPGWTGSACDRCAAATVAGARFICVGTATKSQAAGSPKYLWRSVPSATVASRLAGTFYSSLLKKLGKAAITKTPDMLPGTGALDCWCQSNRSVASTFLSHAAASDNATAILMAQLQWNGIFDNDFGQTVTTTQTAMAYKVGGTARTRIDLLVATIALGISINSFIL